VRPKLSLVGAPQKRFVRVSDDLWLNNQSGYYYVRKTFKRLRIPPLFETTKETTLGKAKSKAAQLVTEHMNKYLGGQGPDLLARRTGKPAGEIIDEILATVTPTKRTGTQANHKIYLGELKHEWGQWDITRITLPAWQTWLTDFRKRKKRRTFGDYQKHMNLLLRYAYRQRYVTHLLTLPSPDPIRSETGTVLTKKEIKALWKVMNEETRDQFVLCFECFMRLREALYLTWDRIDLKTGVVTLRAQDVKTGSKTGKGRSFRLSASALTRMRARRKRIKGSPFVFPSPDNPQRPVHQNKTAWRFAKKEAKITRRIRWHDLRHTALSTALLDSKVDPVLVSEYAGVSVRTIQQVYLHSTHEKTAKVAGSVRIF
jgi:integrase